MWRGLGLHLILVTSSALLILPLVLLSLQGHKQLFGAAEPLLWRGIRRLFTLIFTATLCRRNRPLLGREKPRGQWFRRLAPVAITNATSEAVLVVVL